MIDTDKLTDLEVLAATIDGEAGNQGIMGQRAIAEVVMRRVALKWQGETTVRGVCLHHKQFSCWLPGPDRDRIMKSIDPQCLEVARDALAGRLTNYTKGADSYIVRGTDCYWAECLEPIASVGKHDFFVTVKEHA